MGCASIKEGRAAVVICDMDISRLMVYVYQGKWRSYEVERSIETIRKVLI